MRRLALFTLVLLCSIVSHGNPTQNNVSALRPRDVIKGALLDQGLGLSATGGGVDASGAGGASLSEKQLEGVRNTIESLQSLPSPEREAKEEELQVEAATPPDSARVVETRVLSATHSPARIGTEVVVGLRLNTVVHGFHVGDECTVNMQDVASTFAEQGHGEYTLKYKVKTGHADWEAGLLPVHCELKHPLLPGTVLETSHFTDGNRLAGDGHTPSIGNYRFTALLACGFLFTVVASLYLARAAAKAGLPLVTGYLLTGLLAGPYVLRLIPEEEIRSLRFFDEACLSFIALAAGSHLHLKALRGRGRSIVAVTCSLVLFEFGIGLACIVALSPYIPFMDGMHGKQVLAVGLMAGALVVARSPASAIAIVKELQAQGPFTQTVLGVTILMDLVVIEVFAAAMLCADGLLGKEGARSASATVGLLALQMAVSLAMGLGLAQLIRVVLLDVPAQKFWQTPGRRRAPAHRQPTVWLRVARAGMTLMLNLFVFVLSHPLELYVQPLVVCLSAGFYVVNFTPQRRALQGVLDDLGPLVYLVLFTLTGAALKLDSIVSTFTISLIIFLARVLGLVLGAGAGGVAVGDPRERNCLAWMAYLTQAGVALGLAKKVHLEYSAWGGDFATTIVAVVVMNQVVGPPMLKYVIRRVGEAGRRQNNNESRHEGEGYGDSDAQADSAQKKIEEHHWTA